MTADVVSVRPTSPFAEVARLLHEAQVRAVPVLDGSGYLAGVVSEADLLPTTTDEERAPHWWRPRHVHRRHHMPRPRRAGPTAADLMATSVVTVAPDLTIGVAARRMREQGVAWMPVVDAGGHVVGVLSRSDVLSIFLRDDADICREVVDDVLRRMLLVDTTRVAVDVRGGVVTLTGELDTRAEVELAGSFIERVEGVVGVVNRLRAAVDEGAARYGVDPLS